MIYAKTGMERMPETCADCELYDADWAECMALGSFPYNRRDVCPLTEIETKENKEDSQA